MRTRFIALSAVAVVTLFVTVSAHAQLNKTDGDCPPTALFHPCHDVIVLFATHGSVHSGTTISAPTNSKPSFVVDFTTTGGNVSPTPTLIFARGGQSDLGPCDAVSHCPGDFTNNVTITVPGEFFRDLIVDPQNLSDGAVGLLSVAVNATNATGGQIGDTEVNPAGFSNGSADGNHFLTVEVGPTDEIHSVTISAPAGEGFGFFKQPRVSEIAGAIQTPIPEPSSLLMLGSGVLALAGLLRRKLLHHSS